MSHTHADRVPSRPGMCAAWGCPMQGSISTSTAGSTNWLCWLHFGQDVGRWQRITADLNRLAWLVTAVTTLRRDYGGVNWDEAYAAADRVMRENQRSDLWHVEGEKLQAWFARLDAALLAGCRVIDEPSQQLPLMPA
jgi:hypothetical protein